MSEESSTSMEAMAQDDVSAGNNYFREKGSWTEAMELDSRHPIRNLIPPFVAGADDEEFSDELTDSQWKLVLDRLGPTLRLHGAQQEGQDESEQKEDEDNDQDESGRMEDGNSTPRTLDEKMAALGAEVKENGRADFDNNLSPEEKEHVAALKWATEVIRENNVIEPWVRQIIGACITTHIQTREHLGKGKVGVAVVTLPVEQVNRVLTQCMKAYKELDRFELQDARDPLIDYSEVDAIPAMLGTIHDLRNTLGCVAMIEMQAEAWRTEATEYLAANGLLADELLLGMGETLGRREMTGQYRSVGTPSVRDVLHQYTTNLPLVEGYDDYATPRNIGFAALGGLDLAYLGPMMFLSAQLKKEAGVPWQLVGDSYSSLWLTAGMSLMRPLPLEAGLQVLKAYDRCASNWDPFAPTQDQQNRARAVGGRPYR